MNRRLAFGCPIAAAAVLSVLAAGPAFAADAGTTALPSAHADNGTVKTSVVVGSRLFVGGSFTTVDGAAHAGIAALDAANGTLDPSFGATVNGTVTALATDGINVFLGGSFSSVTGTGGPVARTNLAELAPDGTVLGLDLVPNTAVQTLDYANGVLYLGGKFSKIGATARKYLASVPVDPAGVVGPLTSFNPKPNASVNKVLAAPDGSIYIGGLFTTMGTPTVARNYIADVDPTSNTVQPYNAELTYQSTTTDRAAVLDIALANGNVYLGTGGHLPYGNSLYKTTAGVDAPPAWQVQTDGNIQAVEVVPGSDKIYAGGHFNNLCLPSTTATSCPAANLAPARKTFTADDATGTAQRWVTFDSALGVWDLKATQGNLYALGVFTKPVPRIARFSIL